MKSVVLLSCISVLFLLLPVYSSKVCDYDDTACITRGANNVFMKVVAGIPCVTKSTDPLYLDEIIGKIQCVNYRLSNITMTGLKSCRITNSILKKTVRGLFYEHTATCSKLVLNYIREGKGKLGPVYLNGQGPSTLTATDYIIIFKGKYGKFISKNDCKPHLFTICNYIETDPKGKLILEAEELNKDKRKSKEALAYINSNKIILETFLQSQVMKDLMAKFIRILNSYLRTLPEEEVFPKQMCKIM